MTYNVFSGTLNLTQPTRVATCLVHSLLGVKEANEHFKGLPDVKISGR